MALRSPNQTSASKSPVAHSECLQKGAGRRQLVQAASPSRFTTKGVCVAALCSLVLLLFHYSPFTRPATPAMANIPRPNGRVSVGYFTNWGIYARGYKPDSIPVNDLTHLLYGLFPLNTALNSDRSSQLTRSCESCSFCRRQRRRRGRSDGCLGRRAGKSVLPAEDTEAVFHRSSGTAEHTPKSANL